LVSLDEEGAVAQQPMYRRIAEDLRLKIESGELPPGAQLPTEGELSTKYDGASRNTIREAIRWLTTRRLVNTQPGRGTYVAEQVKQFNVPLNSPIESQAFEAAVRGQGRDPRMDAPKVEVQAAGTELVRELRVEPGSSVVIRHQERFIDGGPSSLQTSYYPMDFVQRGAVELLQAKDITTGATKYVEDILGIKQAGYRDRLRVRSPNGGEVAFFGVPDDGTVLMVVTHRTAYTAEGMPIRYTVTVFPADRNDFVFESGQVPPLDNPKQG
jgi:GntR family transcriptional regulator